MAIFPPPAHIHHKFAHLHAPPTFQPFQQRFNGENVFIDIIGLKGGGNREFIENILNELFSLDILIS
jgi:hypothetical protein